MDINLKTLIGKLNDTTRAAATRAASICVGLGQYEVEIEHLFDVVVGSDDTERHKPDPAPIVHALELLDAPPGDAVYVGDSPFDIRAAKAAGVHAVAVTWGGIHPRERLEAEGPDAVVDTAEELLAAL